MAPIRYTRNLFLRGMCIVYLFAFTSLYIQIPGLYGNNGVLPARTQLESKAKTLSARIQTKPTLLWLAPYVGLNTEYMMDVLALMGIFLAFTGFVSQKFCTAPVFGGLWSLYYSLYQVGQTFMWFQWDILLLEAGFLCILVAPFRYQLLSRRKAPYSSPKDAVSFWLVRWLLFRLMFSSGVVKLTSDCPTWWGLTALTVHFESQCIPTPLAWYAHHLPRWFLKLSTVFAEVAEIGIPHLFFFPLQSVRVVAFYIQLFLQVGIILTGNYNFFNVLTIVLCVSLLDDEFFYTKKTHGSASSSWRWMSKLICFGVYGAVLFATYKLYGLRLMPSYAVESDISFTKQDFNRALSYAVPVSVYVGIASFGIVVLDAVFSSIRTTYGGFPKFMTFATTLLYSCAAAAVLGLSIVPYSELHQAGGNSTAHPVLKHWHSRLSHLHVANSYGLFRRMTGIGGRPEVIIEGSNSIDGPWSEYNFLYKPGNVNATPSFVAPHQPRLDWQMWFAALGTYHQNPWLMSLAYRLLQGQPEVLRLLDTSHNPFSSKPPKYIKASLYHYHYTPWSQRSSNTWWKREKVGEYFPIFSRDHPPLLDYLRNLRILSPEHEKTAIDTELLPWLKALLDQLRFLVSHVEATVLVWSLFTAGCAIIITAGTSPYSNSRR